MLHQSIPFSFSTNTSLFFSSLIFPFSYFGTKISEIISIWRREKCSIDNVKKRLLNVSCYSIPCDWHFRSKQDIGEPLAPFSPRLSPRQAFVSMHGVGQVLVGIAANENRQLLVHRLSLSAACQPFIVRCFLPRSRCVLRNVNVGGFYLSFRKKISIVFSVIYNQKLS